MTVKRLVDGTVLRFRCRWWCAEHCLWCVYKNQAFNFGRPRANPSMSYSELLDSFEAQFVAYVAVDEQSPPVSVTIYKSIGQPFCPSSLIRTLSAH